MKVLIELVISIFVRCSSCGYIFVHIKAIAYIITNINRVVTPFTSRETGESGFA